MPAANAPPQYCLLNWGRLNAFPLNYTTSRLWGSIGGTPINPARQSILIESLSISDRLNEDANTLIATIRGAKPVEGQTISIRIGSASGPPLFAGRLLRTTQVWAADNPQHVLWHVEATNPTWELNATLVTARYRSQSATAIGTALLAFAPAGFTGAIAPGLPAVDEITMTNVTLMDAFVQLAHRIGGYAFCDYDQVIHLFVGETILSPAPLVATHPSLAAVTYTRDLTQVVTRAIVEGGGSNALTPVAVGATDLPVEITTWYNPNGGLVRSGPQRIAYQGVAVGGAGSAVGLAVTPATAPTAAPKGGVGVTAGGHGYAYTWVTATGETLPSPTVATATGSMVTPVAAPVFNQYRYDVSLAEDPATGFIVGATVRYAVTYSTSYTVPYTGSGQPVSALGPPSAPIPLVAVNPDGHTPGIAPMYMAGPGLADPIATYMHFWVSVAGGPWYYANNYAGNPNAGAWTMVTGPNTGATVPAPQAAGQVTLAAITAGPSGTTARKLYRTAANTTTPLRLLQTIANNTATTAVDAAADSALGANAPTADTSGIVTKAGQVNAGSTTILVTSIAPFAVGGGWALVGTQPIHYGGVDAATSSLTGIPASGPGALTASVPYGTVVTIPPVLTGIPASGAGSIVWPIVKGDPVNLLVVVDDTAAQAALAAALGAGASGVREALIQDGRISETEARARGAAYLKAQSRVVETVAHRSRDLNTRSGALVTVDLPPPTDLHGTYRIQDVGISTFHPAAGLPPNFAATSSSSRYTLEDLLRQIANTDPPPTTGETA